jgi:nicotinate phosphoribosyltransferase
MNVSADAPYFDMAYKIVRYAGRNVLKLSAGKKTWTGEKQVYRARGADRQLAGDQLGLRDEPAPAKAEPLLRTVMTAGHAVAPAPTPAEIRERCGQVASLPEDVRRLKEARLYSVTYRERPRALQRDREAEATEVTTRADRRSC